MGKQEAKGQALLAKMRAHREMLVKKYTAGGTIRFDEAIGLIPLGGNPAVSQAATTLGGAPVANNGRREKRVPDLKEDGAVAAANGRVVLDLDAIKAANIADGVASGTMMDALKKRAEGKTIQLFANDAALRWGSVLLGEVQCMLQIQDDITAAIRNAIFPTFGAIGGANTGLAHSLSAAPCLSGTGDAFTKVGNVVTLTDSAAKFTSTMTASAIKISGATSAANNGTFLITASTPTTVSFTNAAGVAEAFTGTWDFLLVESENLSHRGFAKPANYRGDTDYLANPVSLWAEKDGSRQSMMLLGVNSEIRMWGENQVIDLNGKRIGAHERPNRIAPFSSIIDLSNGHFAGLTTKSAKNAHIYSSQRGGRLARNNHFAIRGHGVDGLLVENVISGDAATLNHGSYFGTAIFNDSKRVVFQSVKQEMLNKAVANTSIALSWYAQLTNSELFRGYFERSATWNATGAATYPWMKWDAIAVGAPDTFGNGRTSQFPVIKSEAELVAAGVPAAAAARVRAALLAAESAHRASMKLADDTYIQTNTGHGVIGKSFPMVNNIMTEARQIPRSVNLVAQNPISTDEGVRYPDSVAYGFRIGSTEVGVGKLATDRGGQSRDVYLFDCEFSGGHLSPMEATSLGIVGKGPTNTFNGSGLRILGYTNANTDAASLAPALLLMSKSALEAAAPAYKLEEKPVDSFDTATLAVANAPLAGWTAEQASGLYKGADIQEAGLAAIEAIGLLRRYFTAAAPQAALSGTDNSAVDVGILALRRSMMVALGARTANHVGLKGGYAGDIAITAGVEGASAYEHGEIYPWFVSADGATVTDKDVVLAQAAVAASPIKDRSLSAAYLAAALPAKSDSIYKLKLISADTFALVTGDSETPVTYQMCVDLLGFSATSLGSPDDLSAPVQYKLLRNLDGQNHTHKGQFGVRIDQTADACIKDVEIQGLETADAKKPVQGLGSMAAQLAFGVNAAENPASGALDIHAVSINGATYVEIEDVLIGECHAGGAMFGVRVQGQSSDVSVEQIQARSLEASAGGVLAQPFGDQKVVGVQIAKGVRSAKVADVRASDLAAARPDLAKSVEIEESDCRLS